MYKLALFASALAGAEGAELTARVPAPALRDQLKDRPSLLPYDPLADPTAIVVDSSGSARFTVFTPRLIHMESISGGTTTYFEDRATIAILNRNVQPVPQFKSSEANGVLTISTSEVTLTYTVGQAFSSSSLSVKSNDPSSAFTNWNYGQANPGNLLGTIRGLDGQNQTPLNCTQNQGIDDNGEFNHCEWGLISRDGWVVYDDTSNYALDENDWWSNNGTRRVIGQYQGYDAVNPSNSVTYPLGTTVSSSNACQALCVADEFCRAGWVFDTNSGQVPNCWPLASLSGRIQVTTGRVLGLLTNPTSNTDMHDLYGFFHGHDYAGALADFVLISGRAAMVPRFASGVWWSRWFDISNADTMKIIEDYETRRIPMSTFVLDMNWHTKDNWSGFTFDSHLFPYPADTMAWLKRKGLGITMNIHDASGVNNWEALFPQLAKYLGLPSSATVVPFNLQNATVAYAVEDIILGDLVYNKHVDFWWIDWQQGGDAGGMTGGKQNPTVFTSHIRCTDRHRNGDNVRAMVLARWGGMGNHRYQVGFSGDVAQLTWDNMAYQPYFSATSANVAHGFWSHDIEGPSNDLEMYTRWIQIGAFSGVMRSHDRGMSGGACADLSPELCSVVEVWNVPNVNFEANRAALQAREALLPYIYNGHRSAFVSGLGLIRPMYYGWPALDYAYLMDGNGASTNWYTQYMFGPSILFSPVTNQAQPMMGGAPGVAAKTTWLPPGTWYNALTGVVSTVASTDVQHTVTSNYTIADIPRWYVGGSVLPYLPIRSLPAVGLAALQYSYLGFAVVPGATSGSTDVYEDDGATTDYLTANAYMTTTGAYTISPDQSTYTFTISNAGQGYVGFPSTRAYQIKLLNVGALASVTVNGQNVPFNRWGAVDTTLKTPATSQWYWDSGVNSPLGGVGPVIDLAGMSTASTVTVVIKVDPSSIGLQMSGAFGAISHAITAKLNVDLDRSTPGSNSDAPAYTSVLSSTGEALAYLANADTATFAAKAKSIPQLLQQAASELSSSDGISPRLPYSMAILASARSQ